MNTPEIIISQFEQRQTMERTTFRSKMVSRGFELVGWWSAGIFSLVWLCRKEEFTVALLPVLFVSFVTESLRKRWKLEERVAELEKHAAEAPPVPTRGNGM